MLNSLSKPMQMLLVGVLAVAAYFIVMPIINPAPIGTGTKRTTLPKTSTKKGTDIYLKEDYLAARFDPVDTPIRDAFKPIIAKVGLSGKAALSQVNVVPPEYAGGEANWLYTGTAQIDGVDQALLQNNTTGDSVFLKVGDTWKGITVQEITDDSLVLASPDTGLEHTLSLPPDEALPPGSGPSGFAPARVSNPPFAGNIGNNLTAVPDTGGQDAATAEPNGIGAPAEATAPNAPQSGSTRRGRRGSFGRRGNRGGGG